jgi:hypothetical protein
MKGTYPLIVVVRLALAASGPQIPHCALKTLSLIPPLVSAKLLDPKSSGATFPCFRCDSLSVSRDKSHPASRAHHSTEQ